MATITLNRTNSEPIEVEVIIDRFGDIVSITDTELYLDVMDEIIKEFGYSEIYNKANDQEIDDYYEARFEIERDN